MSNEEEQAFRLSVVKELRVAIDKCEWAGSDWRQKPCHPESYEAATWGSGKIMATLSESGKLGVLAEAYDSSTMELIITMRKHIETLLDVFASTVDSLSCESVLARSMHNPKRRPKNDDV